MSENSAESLAAIRSANFVAIMRVGFWIATAVVLLCGLFNLVHSMTSFSRIEGASLDSHANLVIQAAVGLALTCTGLIMFTAGFVLEIVRSWRDR